MSNKLLHEEVKERIESKFKTIGRFCRCTGIDREQIGKDLFCEKQNPNRNKERTDRFNLYSRLIRETDPSTDPRTISVSLRGKINAAIKECGGVVNFCNDNPSFIKSSIYSIISGRRTKRTDQVNRLIALLGIES